MFPLGPNLVCNSENKVISQLKTHRRNNLMVYYLLLKQSKKMLIHHQSKQKQAFQWLMARHKKRSDKEKARNF